MGGAQGEVHPSALAGGRTLARQQCGNGDILGVVKQACLIYMLSSHTLARLCCVWGLLCPWVGLVCCGPCLACVT